jgi:hypothetical protein
VDKCLTPRGLGEPMNGPRPPSPAISRHVEELRDLLGSMMKNMKPIEALEVGDLEAHAVWQYANVDGANETLVRPIRRLPVARLAGRVVGTRVRLANGSCVWGLLGNIDESNARLTEHFLTLSVFQDGRWFTLARYHDFDYSENGPGVLARFLGLPINEVFPIAYDIRQHVKGEPAALAGLIPKEPRERLSRSELIALAVP